MHSLKFIMVEKLKIAAADLGRKQASCHQLPPPYALVAAFTPDEKEFEWARVELEPHGVKLYTDYTDMLNQEGLQDVVVTTVTKVHADITIVAIDRNLHVLCENLSIDKVCLLRCYQNTLTSQSMEVIKAAQAKPHLKVMCGFPADLTSLTEMPATRSTRG